MDKQEIIKMLKCYKLELYFNQMDIFTMTEEEKQEAKNFIKKFEKTLDKFSPVC